MTLSLLGVNHRTASVDLREKLLPAAVGLGQGLEALRPDCLSEIAVLSTCNRLEVYSVAADSVTGAEEAILERVTSLSGLSAEELDRMVYRKRDRAAVEHLLRVACGLDSQVLGETQVLGQISECLEAGRTGEAIGPLLTTLLSRAVHAGRRARTETDISAGKTSISHVAAALVEAELGGLSGKEVIIVGAGETAAKAMRALYSRGDPHVICLNRSAENAEAMVGDTGTDVLPWPALAQALATADAVITATAAPHPIIDSDDLRPILVGRSARPLVLVDIAVPRDVDPGVGELRGAVLYDIDQLEASLDEGRAGREAAVPLVEDIITEEADAITGWLRSREVAPLVQQVRDRARGIADEEARRALRKLDGLDERQQEIVSTMARQIANKILHEPTVRVKARLREGTDDRYAEVLAEIFGVGANGGERG